MNRIIRNCAAASLSALLLLSGCAGSSAAASTAAAVSSTAAPAAAKETAATLSGTLAGYSGEILSVLSEGKTYSFHVTDQSVFTTTDQLNIGDTVDVSYTGALNGTDGTSATVTKVQDKTVKSPQLQTIAGIVTELTATTVTIQTADALLKFDTSIARMVTSDTIQVGDTLYIDYYGTINGTDTSGCTVQMVVDNNDNKEPIASPAPTSTPLPTAAPTPTPVPTLVPVENIAVVATDEWMYAVSDSSIYRGNSTDYQKISYLYAGQGISVTGRTNDGWTRVNQEGVEGFVPSTCLTSNAPATPTPTATPDPTPEPTATPTPTPAPTPTPIPMHTLYIYYLNKDETQLFTTYIGTFQEGESYSIKSPRNLGTTPSDDYINGTMGTQDVVETVYYTQLYGPSSSPNPTDSGNGGDVG